MKKLIFLSGVSALFFCLSTAAFAQEMKPLIAADASLAQTQAWLAKAIDKNSTYKAARNVTESISAIKFDGCKMSFRTERESRIDPDGTWTQEGDSSRPPLISIIMTTYTFSLKDIAGIELTPISGPNMQLLTLKSPQGKETVNFSYNTGNPRFNKSGVRSSAMMTVKNEVAEQIKASLARTVTLCQNPN